MGFNLYTHLREHGANQEAIKGLKADVAILKATAARLEAAHNNSRGRWQAWATVGTISGTIGAILSRVFFH